MTTLPLSHISVLDLTAHRAGPTAVRQLADWGAHVIKIEAPPGVDPNEGMSGARDGYDMQNLHRNKRSITINLKTLHGVELFKRLVASADVVVENFRPDVKARLGIGYDDLRAVNPRIILASISGFGETGPYRNRAGFDQIAFGEAAAVGRRRDRHRRRNFRHHWAAHALAARNRSAPCPGRDHHHRSDVHHRRPHHDQHLYGVWRTDTTARSHRYRRQPHPNCLQHHHRAPRHADAKPVTWRVRDRQP